MTIPTIELLESHETASVSRAQPVRRLAFYLNERIFAWLHRHPQQDSIDHGVLICAPIGYEQLHSHRSLRHMADRLAMEAIPTLRFDWHGTGDSPGTDQDPARLETWLSNIHAAVQWMRSHLGCRRISLIGLRLGASLAALATQQNQIDNLVLWSPVTKGRSYVREMKALSLTADSSSQRQTMNEDQIEAAGFVLTAETASSLSQFDLAQTPPLSDRTLVVSRTGLSEHDRLCQSWADKGIPLQQISVSGYEEMMTIPHRSQVPIAAIEQMTEWLTGQIHAREQISVAKDPLVDDTLFFQPASDPNQIPIRESTLTIQHSPVLFGIVSEPIRSRMEYPTILLLNGGAAHHVGPNRLNVAIARHLAGQGFRCVRIDFSGMGDSVQETSEGIVDSYPSTMFRDIDHALTYLENDLGAKRIVVMGLCSGAYAAFQAATQIQCPAFIESVLINPLTFFWKEGMSIDDSPTKHLRSLHYYKSVALDPKKWMRLLSGRSKIGIRGAVKLFVRQFKFLGKTSKSCYTLSDLDLPTCELTHPEIEDLPRDLQRIADAERRIALFCSKTDPGLEILNFHARKKARQLRARQLLKSYVIEGADHTFTMDAARIDLINSISSHLHGRYCKSL